MSPVPPGLHSAGAGAVRGRLDGLRAELADLAWSLERKGRTDAADIVMLIDRRVREVTDEIATEHAGADEAAG